MRWSRESFYEIIGYISFSLLFILFISAWFTTADLKAGYRFSILFILIIPSLYGAISTVRGKGGILSRLLIGASVILFIEGFVQSTGYRESPLYTPSLLSLSIFPVFYPFLESILLPYSFLILRVIPLTFTSKPGSPLHTSILDLVSTALVIFVVAYIIDRERKGKLQTFRDMERLKLGARDLSKRLEPQKYHYSGGTFGEKQEERLIQTYDLIEDGIRVFTEVSASIFSPDTCAVYRLEEDGRMLLVSGISKDEGEPLCETDWRIGIVRVVYETKAPHLLTGSAIKGKVMYRKRDTGIKSMMIFPIMSEEMIWGVLIIDSKMEEAFDERSMEKGGQIAHLIETFLSGTHEASRYREIYEETRALSNFSMKIVESLDLDRITDTLLDNMSSILRFDYGFVIVYDEEEGEGKIVRAIGIDAVEFIGKRVKGGKEGGIAGEVLEKRIEVIRSGLKRGRKLSLFGKGVPNPKEVGAFLFLPMKVGKITVGALLLIRRRDIPFSEMEVKRVSIITNQSAVCIRNAIAYVRERELAITDGLTGLYNHRYFQELLEREVERAKRRGEIFSLVMMDIDHFKNINDTYGHQVGDAVLRKIGQILRSESRVGEDIAARYGGEEFSLFLGGADREDAIRIVERIRQIVASEVFISPKEGIRDYVKFHVTISAGISLFPYHGKDRETLISKADESLYEAKRMGRNRVILREI